MKMIRLALLLFVMFLMISCDETTSTRDQVEKKITQDLPVGSGYNTVRQYLEINNIEYSWTQDDNAFHAIIRDVGGDFLVKESIELVIHMDAEKKLRTIDVKSVFTGP